MARRLRDEAIWGVLQPRNVSANPLRRAVGRYRPSCSYVRSWWELGIGCLPYTPGTAFT